MEEIRALFDLPVSVDVAEQLEGEVVLGRVG